MTEQRLINKDLVAIMAHLVARECIETGVLAIRESDGQPQVQLSTGDGSLRQIAPVSEWTWAESGWGPYPYEASAMYGDVRFFTMVNEEEREKILVETVALEKEEENESHN